MNCGRLTISVVICAYADERWEELATAVASVQRQTRPAAEIVVVVDHNEKLLERARAALPGVVVVPNTGARGLSGARNSGVAATSGDVIAFLDDDAFADPEWLELLAGAYADERVLGAGGEIEPLWEGGRPRSFPREFEWVVGCTYRGMPTSTSRVRNPIGANMSFRRSVFDVVGGFQSAIGRIGKRPVGCEETELCIRAQRRWSDGIFLYEPAARVHHHVPANRAHWRYFVARCYAEGLSKAVVSRLVGSRDGLSSERSYTLRTLPRGVGRGVADALFRRDIAGLARAGAIVAGLATTTAGYVVGTARRRQEVSADA